MPTKAAIEALRAENPQLTQRKAIALLLKGVELEEEEVKPENVGDWLRRLSSEV